MALPLRLPNYWALLAPSVPSDLRVPAWPGALRVCPFLHRTPLTGLSSPAPSQWLAGSCRDAHGCGRSGGLVRCWDCGLCLPCTRSGAPGPGRRRPPARCKPLSTAGAPRRAPRPRLVGRGAEGGTQQGGGRSGFESHPPDPNPALPTTRWRTPGSAPARTSGPFVVLRKDQIDALVRPGKAATAGPQRAAAAAEASGAREKRGSLRGGRPAGPYSPWGAPPSSWNLWERKEEPWLRAAQPPFYRWGN